MSLCADPEPGPGEVVLAIKASGMCGSDLHTYRAPRSGDGEDRGIGKADGPIIAGHEPCGVVMARGPSVTDREAPISQRVMNHHKLITHHFALAEAAAAYQLFDTQTTGKGVFVF